MEKQLRANDYKGGWQNMFAGELVTCLQEELEEIREALRAPGFGEKWKRAAIHETADLANFAMMLKETVERS
jgi:hypothetical protein